MNNICLVVFLWLVLFFQSRGRCNFDIGSPTGLRLWTLRVTFFNDNDIDKLLKLHFGSKVSIIDEFMRVNEGMGFNFRCVGNRVYFFEGAEYKCRRYAGLYFDLLLWDVEVFLRFLVGSGFEDSGYIFLLFSRLSVGDDKIFEIVGLSDEL